MRLIWISLLIIGVVPGLAQGERPDLALAIAVPTSDACEIISVRYKSASCIKSSTKYLGGDVCSVELRDNGRPDVLMFHAGANCKLSPRELTVSVSELPHITISPDEFGQLIKSVRELKNNDDLSRLTNFGDVESTEKAGLVLREAITAGIALKPVAIWARPKSSFFPYTRNVTILCTLDIDKDPIFYTVSVELRQDGLRVKAISWNID